LVTAPPDFVGIGAQKAGTTWWFDLITSHPGVYHHPPYNKERHVLSHWGSGGSAYPPEAAADYASWFPRPAGVVSGEWTPAYLYYYWVAELLAEVAPDTKVLVLLRDPVDRYLSGLVHRGRAGEVPSPSDTHRAFERGLYAEQLTQWERIFGRDQMLVLQYERCVREPAAELARTFRFLGLGDDHRPPVTASGHTGSAKPGLSPKRLELLRTLYEPDVTELVRRHPQVDLSLWPHFSHLAPPVG
jgi:hypothetical protein